MKNLKLFSLIAVGSIVLVGCGDASSEVGVTGVEISSVGDVNVLEVESTLQLTAKVLPQEVSQEVSWSTSNTARATVSSQGLVTGISEGNVMITAVSSYDTSFSKDFAITIIEKSVPVIVPEAISISVVGGATSVSVGANIKLNAVLTPVGSDQGVNWTTSNKAVATIDASGNLSGLAEGEVTVTATSKVAAAVSAEVTIAVTPVVPDETWEELPFSTHNDFMTVENDTKLKVKGKVSLLAPVSSENKVSYYVQDGTEGYYIYNQNAILFPVEDGKSYEIGGYKKNYNGQMEIVDVEYFKEAETSLDYSVTNISSMDITNRALMNPYHASWVKIDLLTVSSAPTPGDKAYSVKTNFGDKSFDLRIDPYNMSSEELSQINAIFTGMAVSTPLTVTGIMSAFGFGTPANQLQVVKASDILVAGLSDTESVESAARAISLPHSVLSGVASIELPTSLEALDGVTIAWSSNSSIITDTGVVTQPLNDTEATLKATISKGSVSIEKDFTIYVFGSNQSKLIEVHTLNLEDALPKPEGGFGNNSASKSGYAEGEITLGTPNATWLVRNGLIGAESSDVRNGSWAFRLRKNANIDSSARLEIKEDYDFNLLEFKTARYGSDAAADLRISYSTDSGETWTHIAKEYDVTNTETLQTIRVSLPTEGNIRVAITLLSARGNRVNVDDIRLLRAA